MSKHEEDAMKDFIWIDRQELLRLSKAQGFKATGIAMELISAWAENAYAPLPGDAESLAALLRSAGEGWLEDARPFFVTLPDGRLVPSPSLISLTDPYTE